MSTAELATEPAASGIPPWPVRRFTVDEYHAMANEGILDESDKVELLEGWIVPRSTRTPRHEALVSMTDDAFRRVLSLEWFSRVHPAVTTVDSEPEPDLAIVRGPIRRYIDHHPRPDEIALVVEVADTSVDRDHDKVRIYGRAGVPEYWIVNLVEEVVEVYRQPTRSVAVAGYGSCERLERGGEIGVMLGDSDVGRIAVGDLLP